MTCAVHNSHPDAAQLGDTGTSNRYADCCVLITNLPRIHLTSERPHGGSSETKRNDKDLSYAEMMALIQAYGPKNKNKADSFQPCRTGPSFMKPL